MSTQQLLGFDEVGRGCLAGPVVVACVLYTEVTFNQKTSNIVIRDSKTMTAKQRNLSAEWIRKWFCYGIGEASAVEIDQRGIVHATKVAARRAFEHFCNKTHLWRELEIHCMNDGKDAWFDGGSAVIKGDVLVPAISMAAIVAKTYRDKHMQRLEKLYNGWGFATHVGYGTRLHRSMIAKYGMIEGLHRRSFCRKFR